MLIKAALPSTKQQVVTVYFGGLSWKVIKGAGSLHSLSPNKLITINFYVQRG